MTALFIGHGSPMTAFSDNQFCKEWGILSRTFPTPSAILVISAHWLSDGTYLTGDGELETIHDFYGFPREFYQYHYPAKGSSYVASEIQMLVPEITIDAERGLDHGAWSLLKNMFPIGNIPVVQLSLSSRLSLKEHLELAARLSPLLGKNILILGSGNVVHNLERVMPEEMDPSYCWARRFEERVKKALIANDTEELLSLPFDLNGGGPQSVPTLEHYLPLLYIYALRQEGEKLSFPIEGIVHGSLSMLSFLYR